MAQNVKAKNPVKATQTTFQIIEALQELGGARVTEIATHLNKSKGSIHNHLSTLYELGYVTKHNNKYQIGLRFLEPGIHARQQQPLYEIAKTEIETLAEKTGELVNLLVEEHGLGIYLHRASGNNAVNVDAQTGTRVSLHNTALGKAILAHLPEARVETILDRHGMSQTTDHTVTDRDTLFDHLDTVRERGVAFDDEERLSGLQCVAVPIVNEEECVEGALSVSVPTRRMQDSPLDGEIPTMLKDAANVIQLNITYL